MKHRLFDEWLSTTDCGNCYYNRVKHRLVFENDTHIVFKHGSHSSYINRMVGSRNCEVYHVLYSKDVDVKSLEKGSGFIKQWYGRMTTSKLEQLLKDEFGLEFDKDYQSSEWYEPAPEPPSELTLKARALTNADFF